MKTSQFRMFYPMFTAGPIFVILIQSNRLVRGRVIKIKDRGFKISFVLCICLGASKVSAQGATSTPGSTEIKLKPITINYTTLGGLRYSLGDMPLLNGKDFEDAVSPLRDYEVSRLLKTSESAGVKSTVFETAGIAGLATGVIGLLTTHAGQQTGFWITAIGGAVSFDIGTLFRSESETSKFNSVQRYNRFARGEEQILPKQPQDEKSLLDFNKTVAPAQTGPGDKAGK